MICLGSETDTISTRKRSASGSFDVPAFSMERALGRSCDELYCAVTAAELRKRSTTDDVNYAGTEYGAQ